MDDFLNPFAGFLRSIQQSEDPTIQKIWKESEQNKRLVVNKWSVTVLEASPDFIEKTARMKGDQLLFYIINPESMATPVSGILGPRGYCKVQVHVTNMQTGKETTDTKEINFYQHMISRYLGSGDMDGAQWVSDCADTSRLEKAPPPENYPHTHFEVTATTYEYGKPTSATRDFVPGQRSLAVVSTESSLGFLGSSASASFTEPLNVDSPKHFPNLGDDTSDSKKIDYGNARHACDQGGGNTTPKQWSTAIKNKKNTKKKYESEFPSL